MIAGNTLFDSRGRFSGSSYPIKSEDIAKIKCLRVVAIATTVGTKIAITGFV